MIERTRKNRLIGLLAALIVGLIVWTLIILGAGKAFADEGGPVDVTVLAEEPIVAPEETPAPEPTVESIPELPVEEPITLPEAVVAPAPVEDATLPQTQFVLALWKINAAGEDIWPGQTLADSTFLGTTPGLDALDNSEALTCSTRYQVDLYVDSAITTALLAGGVLNGPNNPAEFLANGFVDGDPWKYITTDACPTPVETVDPIVCSAYSDWYTEDNAPEQSDEGLYFEGSSPQPVNWLHPTNGNFQGFTGASYTLTDVAGYHTAYRFVVNPNTTIHYASVSVEPYINGWVAGQSGTFTITPASLAWSSKILTGPGSQSEPVALSTFGDIWPDNAFISQGFHLGSTNNADTYSTVSAVTGCLAFNFVPVVEDPEPTPTPTPTPDPTPTEEPTPTPTPTETVVAVPLPTSTASETPAPVVASSYVAPSELGHTGFPLAKWIMVIGILLFLGALFVALGGARKDVQAITAETKHIDRNL